MSGISIDITIAGLEPALNAVSKLSNLDKGAFLDGVGAILDSGQRRRIEETKTAPDGSSWAPNRAGTSTLLQTGTNLRDSSGYSVSGDAVEVGFGWEFAHVHHFGATIVPVNGKSLTFKVPGLNHPVNVKSVKIPARPMVGLSAEDRTDIIAFSERFLGALQ
jgi:phage gpG-like protein